MASLLAEVRKDWPIYAVILAYTLIAAVLAQTLGEPQRFQPFMYFHRWFGWAIGLVAIGFTAVAAAQIGKSDPVGHLRNGLLRHAPPARLAGLVLVLTLGVFQGVFASVKTLLPEFLTYRWDAVLADLDFAIHGTDPWRLLPRVHAFTIALQGVYMLGWMFMLTSVTVYAAMFAPKDLRTRYIWTFLVTWILLGNVVAGLGMSAGPAYYERLTGSGRFRELMDYLAFSRDMTFSSINIQDYLWNQKQAGMTKIGGGISAFPSMHLSMGMLWVLTARRVHIGFGAAMTTFAVILLLGSVHLGWHYAIDGYFSIVVTLIVWKAIGWCLAARPAPALAPAQ